MSGRRAIWALLLSIASTAPASGQDQGAVQDNYEIVVSGKLRALKLDYQARGTQLRTCRPIDRRENKQAVRLMCTILRACVARGYAKRDAAQACINETLGALERRAAAPERN